MPATSGNQIDVLRNGDAIFSAMLEAIGDAKRSVDFLSFVFWQGEITDQFTNALCERAEAGVRVRVMLDALGSRHISSNQIQQMQISGCDFRWFRPVDSPLTRANHRTHRKILICDEVVAFTGGVGIAAEWTGDAQSAAEWRDTHFRVRGQAVDGLRGAFIDNWIETGPLQFDEMFDRFPDHGRPGNSTVQVVTGAAEAGGNDIATLLELLVQGAEKQLRITTAYFNPDDEFSASLIAAAHRGVQIQVLLPGRHADKRFVQIVGEARYAELLEEGIEIRSYATSMLHAKILTVDGAVATVGSANINQRSVQFDEEVNLVIFDSAVVAELDAHFDADLINSELIDPSTWAERSMLQRAAERAASVVSDLI